MSIVRQIFFIFIFVWSIAVFIIMFSLFLIVKNQSLRKESALQGDIVSQTPTLDKDIKQDLIKKFYNLDSSPEVVEEEKEEAIVTSIEHNVPFTPQAPFGNWDDIRQQNACEEASALMAMRWVKGEGLSLGEAEREVLSISGWLLETYGHFHDTSARDVVERIFKVYFQYENVQLVYGISVDDIKRELTRGNLVIVPINGQKLNNPYFTPPGPIEHMLVIRGYDETKGGFITNDPGTKKGEGYRYSETTLYNALQDYPSGYHEPITELRKVMIVVSPKT